jgi:hypothetical protein
VSHRAITLELFGHGPQGLVDVAEQVELGFGRVLDEDQGERTDRFQRPTIRKGHSDE